MYKGIMLTFFLLLSFSYSLPLRCIDFVAQKLNVSPLLLIAIYKHESNLHPYAIGISKNGVHLKSYFPKSKREAILIAKELLKRGYHVDLGLGQISVKNLKRWGVPIEEAFEPCKNVLMSGVVLSECFKAYGRTLKALDCYNKGRKARSFSKYVLSVIRIYNRLVKSLR